MWFRERKSSFITKQIDVSRWTVAFLFIIQWQAFLQDWLLCAQQQFIVGQILRWASEEGSKSGTSGLLVLERFLGSCQLDRLREPAECQVGQIVDYKYANFIQKLKWMLKKLNKILSWVLHLKRQAPV